MGRVHKKKLAEYAEAAENEELNKSNEEGGGGGDADASAEETMHKGSAGAAIDDGDKSSSNDETDAEDEITLAAAAKKAPEADGATEEDDDEFQSLHGEVDADAEPEKNGKKSAPKRKTAEKKAAVAHDDEDDEVDDESLNGASPPKRGRKAAGAGKAKAPAKGKAGGRGRPKANAKKPAPTVADDDDEEDEEEEYEVKDIVDHKTERGVSYFLIRWKGYTKADDTWEPENELSCPEIIDKYKKKQSANGGKSPKKGASPAKRGRGSTAGAKAKEDPNKEWEVDKIIDYAQEKSGRVFRIRWKGFGPKYDTWEPENNLYCDDIIKKFMKRMKLNENVSFKELREDVKKPRRLYNETAPRTNYHNAIGRKSKRGNTKKRVYYGDSDD